MQRKMQKCSTPLIVSQSALVIASLYFFNTKITCNLKTSLHKSQQGNFKPAYLTLKNISKL